MNNNNKSISTEKAKIIRPEAKFLLGFFAGVCSCFLPRLMVALNASADLIAFEKSYIICAMIFSAIVGIVVMILEWKIAVEPGKTFMMALSLPALLSGTINTNDAIQFGKRASAGIEEMIQREEHIPISKDTVKNITPLSKIDDNKSNDLSLSFPLIGISEAYASDARYKSDNIFAFRERLYIIVLDRASNRQIAARRARELKASIREATPVDIGGRYYVILGNTRLPRTEALIRADQLRRNYSNLGLNPELLPLE